MTRVICAAPALADAGGMSLRPASPGMLPPLARLRAEHRRALRHVVAVTGALEPRRAPGMVHLRALRAFAGYLEQPFEGHLAREESVLFPALVQAIPEAASAVSRLREDHAELRAMTRCLRALLAAEPGPRRDERLIVLARDLADLLRLHIEAEERSAFTWGERVFFAGGAPRTRHRTTTPPRRSRGRK